MKTINIKVIANARKVLVKEEAGNLKVYVAAPAVEGKANKAVIELLANYFGIKKGQIEITKGLQSKNKTINIYDNLEPGKGGIYARRAD